MALRHAILTRLARGDTQSGYELAAHFTNLNEPLWNASPSQVYSELRKMETTGLIRVHTRSERGATSYAITPAGLDEIRRWLLDDDVDRTTRDDATLRIVMLWSLDPTVARHLLEAEVSFERKRVMYLRRLLDEWDPAKTAPIQRFRFASLALWAAQTELRIAWLSGLKLVHEHPDADVRQLLAWHEPAPRQLLPEIWAGLTES
jgi:DNA-binding PadR family transcriptional regulator